MPPFDLEYDINTADDRMHPYKTFIEFTTFAGKHKICNSQILFLLDLCKN